MSKKIIMIGLISVVVIAGGAFYGGIIYAKSKSSRMVFTSGNLQNLTPEQRQQFMQRGGTRGANGGFVDGEIISKDDKSITVKMQDGNTKIIFLADSTTIGKTTDGTKDDLTQGKQVIINGTSNTDGTITAQNIQIRPNILAPSSN